MDRPNIKVRPGLQIKSRRLGSRNLIEITLLMRMAILRSGTILAMAVLGTSTAIAQTELFFASGVDRTGWAQAQSNDDGDVLIESPEYPRGLWFHLVNEAGDALSGILVEYQGRPDSLVAVHFVDPAGGLQETLFWTRPSGHPLSLTLKPKGTADQPPGLAAIDWQIDPGAELLLEPVTETALVGREALAAFLRERRQGGTHRVAVRVDAGPSLAVELDHPEVMETLVNYLQRTHRPADSPQDSTAFFLYTQVFREGPASLQEGIIFYPPLFADAHLESMVREALGGPQGGLIPEDVASLTGLTARSKAIRSLMGIEHLTSLRWLHLANNQIVDLSPLAGLTSLQSLTLDDNQIVDLVPLNQLTNLRTLSLYNNQIVDLDPLNELTNLSWLWLDDNQISEINPLKSLINLQELALEVNQIEDIKPLSQLNNLNSLSLSGNWIADLQPLNQLTELVYLRLIQNQITDITPLESLINLEDLHISSNEIADLNPLADLINLERLDLGRNLIVDLEPLKPLVNLIWLRLNFNFISDITPLKSLIRLGWLDLYYNEIANLSPLVANSGLGEGDELFLMDNPLSLQARNEQIPALKARGVAVYY